MLAIRVKLPPNKKYLSSCIQMDFIRCELPSVAVLPITKRSLFKINSFKPNYSQLPQKIREWPLPLRHWIYFANWACRANFLSTTTMCLWRISPTFWTLTGGQYVIHLSDILYFAHRSRQKRYEELSRVLRRYKHLLMLKWAGRGNDRKGVEATKSGELAVECPACPHPGRNMPYNPTEQTLNKPWVFFI